MCGSYANIPSHITVIYIFAVVNLTVLFNLALVEARIVVLDSENKTVTDFNDLPANFGPRFPEEGLWGHVQPADPLNGCEKFKSNASKPGLYIALIIRGGGCNFDFKVANAQNSNYIGAIVYNDRNDDLIPMGGSNKIHVLIPSVFIGRNDGLTLGKYYSNSSFSVLIDSDSPFNPNFYLLPFAIVVGICFVLMFIFMIAKFIRDYRKKKKSRLSKEHLKKLPIKKYKKGDQYDVCAICLDDYEEGEKLRVLPCSHAYHMKCIDPWLTKNKRNCPVCKRKVIPGDTESDSETETDSEQDTPSENTPLIGSRSSGNSRQIGGAQNAVSVYVDSDAVSTDSGSYNENFMHQSQAIVHDRGSPASWPGSSHMNNYGAINQGFDENKPETTSVQSLGIVPSVPSAANSDTNVTDDTHTECVVDIIGTNDLPEPSQLT